jgi:hypothetical protein
MKWTSLAHLLLAVHCQCVLADLAHADQPVPPPPLVEPVLPQSWTFQEPLKVCFVSLLDFRCSSLQELVHVDCTWAGQVCLANNSQLQIRLVAASAAARQRSSACLQGQLAYLASLTLVCPHS